MSQSNGALQERDEAKTRKLAEARLSKEEREDLERRKYTTEEEKEGLLPQLGGPPSRCCASCKHQGEWHDGQGHFLLSRCCVAQMDEQC